MKQTRSVLTFAVATLTLVLVLAAWPATPVQAQPPAKPGQPQPAALPYLSPMVLDAYGEVDPLDAFQAWREANRVTLPVTPLVEAAHHDWLRFHGLEPFEAQEETINAGAETISVGGNACPAGGVTAYQGEVTIAVNPNNTSQVVGGANTFYQDPSSGCQAPSGTTYGTQALYASGDGGSTWTYQCAPWPSNDTGSVGPIMYGSDPSVAWDRNNNAYATYMLVSQNSSGTSVSSSIVVAKSTNGGTSWSPLGVVIDNLSNSSSFDDKDMMAIDTSGGTHNGRIYVIWDENNRERVAYSDTGLTGSWTTVVLDSTLNIGGDVAVGADGTVYAVWNRLIYRGNRQTGETTVFSKSTNGGVSWSSPVTIASHNLLSFGNNNKPPAQDKRGVNAFASIAVDTGATSPYKGSLYVSYNDFPSGTTSGTNLNTYFVRSSNGGSTWSNPLQLNDDSGTATQFFPWVAVDPSNGSVNVSWYDTRNDPNNRKTQIFYAQSTNGGTSFGANVLVTQASSQFANSTIAYSDENSTDNTKYNANQYGDYAQISAGGGHVFCIWTDSRQFYPSNTSNTLKEDAATAAITAP